eukprot:TRINITY_DN34156_c3_g3_i1.p1 TRINITY_DN34156_c3_g3~~TRINITY_DN34156_c3_g3_i1.p1  ORF type:complete len:609 (-),score=131.54 TRINITY_DN34156_c3_g3_i1:3-1829(-)
MSLRSHSFRIASEALVSAWLATPPSRTASSADDVDVMPTQLDAHEAMDAGIFLAVACLLATALWHRPKSTSVVMLIWLSWSVYEFASGQDEWATYNKHLTKAREATEDAAEAIGQMFAAWFVLILPFFVDLEQALQPVAVRAWKELVHIWSLFTWQQKAIGALVTAAFLGTAWAAVAAYRAVKAAAAARAEAQRARAVAKEAEGAAREEERRQAWQDRKQAAKAIMFQLSFVVVGPLVWICTGFLSGSCASLLVVALMSLVPMVISLAVLLRVERHRAQQKEDKLKEQEQTSPSKSWFSLPAFNLEVIVEDVKPELPQALQDRVLYWLSYWSCWPVLAGLHALSHTEALVKEDSQASADGLVLALVVWVTVWEQSRFAPYMLGILARLFSCVTVQLSNMTDSLSVRAPGVALQAAQRGNELVGQLGSKSIMVAVVGLAVASAILLALRVVAFLSSLLTLVCFWGVALDSARCVAKRDADLCVTRLAFWVITIAWLAICEIPVLSIILEVWTPILLVFALLMGETLLHTALNFSMRCCARCVIATLGGSDDDAATPDGKQAASCGDLDKPLLVDPSTPEKDRAAGRQAATPASAGGASSTGKSPASCDV